MRANMIRLTNNGIQKGYSIIEVMLTLVVVGVGLLAIVQLQSGISTQVGDNKAKAEATAIAEARIEEMRNYTNQASSLADFQSILVASANTTINGVNADFVRQEAVTDIGDIKNIEITVAWTDRNNVSRNVVVTSEIAFVAAESFGQAAISYLTNDGFSLPRGIATIGEGTLSDLSGNKQVTPNDDGTQIVIDGNNKYLAVGEKIVLTMENVCDSGKCDEEFTRIHGRVYIDRATYPDLTVGQINLVASNAAYCTRIYNSSNEPFYYEKDGNVSVSQKTDISLVTNASTTGNTTTVNGDYDYFDYTCYVSRGWYGNIGVYVNESDENKFRNIKVCMGDPSTGNITLADYILQAYRAYRGMIYETDDTSGDVISSSIRSIGVAGGLELGLAEESSNKFKPLDNFVVSLLPASAGDQACIDKGVLVRQDAEENKLFADVPDDFVCLNPNNIENYDTAVYTAADCPFDPTDVP